MKRFVSFAVLVIFAISFGFSQEDIPIPPKRTRAARVGGLAGFMPGWLFLDVKPVNEFLLASRGAPLKDNGVFLLGGGGSVYIMLVPNLRVGGLGMSGSLSSTSLDGLGVRRDAKLTAGFGGVTFEYVLPIVERLDVTLGTMLGGGGVDLLLRRSTATTNTWPSEGDFFAGTGQVNNFTRKLSGSFFVWMPSFNVEYAVLGWIAVRVGLSYVGMSSPSWDVDDRYELLGVPSSVNGQGVMINAGLFVGTF